MTELLAILFKLGGVFFIYSAVAGLLRFADPLQSIHAATKTGTVGAGLIIIGVLLQFGSREATLIGAATVIFLMLTVPVAGHLLGRAAYVSGVRLQGLRGDDPLAAALKRSPRSLDDVLEKGAQRRDGGRGEAGGERLR